MGYPLQVAEVLRCGKPQVGTAANALPRPGSSVGTSVRLKIGRSAVRPRPWPPQTCRSEHWPAVLLRPNLANASANSRLGHRAGDVRDTRGGLTQDVGVDP